MNDITGLSKPLEKLIGEVSKSLGVIYEPTRIRRRAKAEKDAELIKLEGEIEKSELLRRAAQRIGHIEVNRQVNIDNTIAASTQYLPEIVSDKSVDPDWMARFFDGCQDVSEETVQKLWAKILAREISEPGRFSALTLTILRTELSCNATDI